ncbi:aminoglycoside phosphotransferase family protein [Flindersiella endophytica]
MEEHRLEFTASENPWAPTKVVAEINASTGSELELVGLAAQVGGVSSAAFVRWPDGRPGAITRPNVPLELMQQTAGVLSLIRARGLPVPRHELVLRLSDGKVTVVQERLPGNHLTYCDAGVVDEMVAMNERFAGLLADRPDVPPPPAFPALMDAGNPWQQTLGRYSERSRRLLGRLREIDAGHPFEMTGDDVVHLDYSLGNVLFDEHGKISGVVDWNYGIARGDRHFALLGLRDHLVDEGDRYEERQAAFDRLDEILDAALGADLLYIYRAHRSAQSVHYSMSNGFRAAKIEHDIEVAECHLDGTTPPPQMW